jgi:RimJ/RimL family protein N-acetyltransferase
VTFIAGKLCELRVLHETPDEVRIWTDSVNAGLTTKHLFTGSFPMRYIDVAEKWRKERLSGDVLFGIWTLDNGPDHPGRFIGTCGLHGHREIYRSWELRILIFDPHAIGWGIGTEATALLVNYAFQRLNAHRVWLGVSSANEGAIKCYGKVGFKEEGRLRDEIFTYGKYHDAIRMGILENEWKSIAS